ncbi:fungal-specific transcription factor domain-containing protein [Mycena leptocephala]|nr:fungal-specific transcription factor domain-containing protein [Mycena leptocephala]
MPVDRTKASNTNAKRPQEAVSAEYIAQSVPGDSGMTRELEVERSRGAVSCAECTRLKVATGQLHRKIAQMAERIRALEDASTEHLHRKNARLSERIRILEDALTALHASKDGADGAVHPLLVEGEDFSLGADDAPTASRRMSESWEVLEGPGGKAAVASPSWDVIDAFGTLSISDHGISRFFGPTGGSESLLAHDPGTPTTTSASAFALPFSSYSYGVEAGQTPPHPVSPATLFSSSSFPLTPIGPPHAIHALVRSHLPSRARARALVRAYFAQLVCRGVTRGQVGDMMRGVYGPGDDADGGWDEFTDGDREPADAVGDEEEYTGPHDFALLFMVFAVGALVLPGAEEGGSGSGSGQAEAEHLHQIARAALALQSVLEKPSLVTIQALHLLSIYTGMAAGPGPSKGGEEEPGTSMEMTWSLIALAANLSQTIGLHRDSARWGLSAKMVQRRRILFWDLFVSDVWQSLNTGRPPSFSLAYIDCSFPTPRDGVCTSLHPPSVLAVVTPVDVWQFRFAAECVAEVTARTLTAEAPSYATIMELDRKVREFPPPPPPVPAPDDVGASLQDSVLGHTRETLLMYIHRSFFAQAIIEEPVNPLKSAYAPSFLAAYRASATILKSVREQFAVTPNACARSWTMWTFAFSAAVVFGTVVTRGPRSPLAVAAMAEFKQACVLFSKAAVYSRRATKALPILTKLAEKARHALAVAQSDPGDNAGLLWSMTGEPDDELSIFAGHTRFVSGQVQRSGQGPADVAFPPQQQQTRARQQFHHAPGQSSMQGGEDMQYGSYDVSPQRQYPAQYPAPPQQASQWQHSMPSSSSFHGHAMPPPQLERLTPTVNVNVNLNWDGRNDSHDYPQLAQDNVHWSPPSVMDEHMQHFYVPDSAGVNPALPPLPTAPYAWPVDSYLEEHPQQHSQRHHQAHNDELAQLGLAARDSHLDERWSTFLVDLGLLDGIDFGSG